MTQPNLVVKGDASTAIATATTWSASSVVANGLFVTKGSATDLELFVTLGTNAGTVASGSLSLALVGSATSAFSTTASITPDKGTLGPCTTVSWTAHAHYAQLQYPYYRVQYTPTAAGNVTGEAMSVFVFSGIEDTLDASDL